MAVTLTRKRKTEIIVISAALNWDPYCYEEATISTGNCQFCCTPTAMKWEILTFGAEKD